MSISEKITALAGIKEDIKQAATEKGADMNGVPFTDYAEKIRGISSSGGVALDGMEIRGVLNSALKKNSICTIGINAAENSRTSAIEEHPETSHTCAWSGNGKFLAVTTWENPGIKCYRRGITGSFSSVPVWDGYLSEAPGDFGVACAFTRDGTWLAQVMGRPPDRLRLYKLTDDGSAYQCLTDTPQPNSSSGPGGGCSFSPDGEILACAFTSSSYVHLYRRDGETFTKLNTPEEPASGGCSDCAWSPDGQYLAVSSKSTPYIAIYKWDGASLALLAAPPAGATEGMGLSWSPDSIFLTMGNANGGAFRMYKRNGDAFSRVSTALSGYGTSFSPDGAWLVICLSSSQSLGIYSKTGNTFTAAPDGLTDPPVNPGRYPKFSPDGDYLAVTHEQPLNFSLYKVQKKIYAYKEQTTPFLFGVTLGSGEAGEEINAFQLMQE